MKIHIEASLELAFSPKPPNFVPPLEFAARIDRTGRGPGLHAARDEWALFSAPLFGRPRAGAAAPVPVPPLALSVSVTLCVTLPRLARSRPKPPGSL